jgi:hypothetical protein
LEARVEPLYQREMIPIVAIWWSDLLKARNGKFLRPVDPELAAKLAVLPRRMNWPVFRRVARALFKTGESEPDASTPETVEECILVVAYAMITVARGPFMNDDEQRAPAQRITVDDYVDATKSYSEFADWEGRVQLTSLLKMFETDRVGIIGKAMARELERLYSGWSGGKSLEHARQALFAADVIWQCERTPGLEIPRYLRGTSFAR